MSRELDAMLRKTAEIQDNFSYDGYQVARGELFAHLRKPAITIRKDSITFNTACINGLEDAVYIQIMVNRDQKRIAIRKCSENDKDAVRWCISKPDKRRSRKITSRPFSERIYALMGWDKGCRYKIIGHQIEYQGDILYVFVLEDSEITKERKRKTREEVMSEAENQGVSPEQLMQREAEEAKMAKKPFYPDDWSNSFGVPVDVHRNVSLDNTDGFGSYGDWIATEQKE